MVGGGFANVSALQRTVQQVKEQGLKLKPGQVHMRIYDVRHDFIGGGEAYAASSPDMMFNTVARSMFHGDKDKEALLYKWDGWLHRDVDHWLKPLEAVADNHEALATWLSRHAENLRQSTKSLNDLFIPRVVMGQFLREELYHTMQEAKQLGIQVDLIEAEIEDMEKNQDGTINLQLNRGARNVNIEEHDGEVSLSRGEQLSTHTLRATETVLGLGFAPRRRYQQLEPYEHGAYPRYFSNQTSQKNDRLVADEDASIVASRADVIKESIWHYHEQHPERRVKIACFGTGPAFRDLCGVLSDPDIARVVKIYGFSNSAKTPKEPYHRFPHDDIAETKLNMKSALKMVDHRVEPRDVRMAKGQDVIEKGFVKVRTEGGSEFFDMVFNFTPHLGPAHHPLVVKARRAGICKVEGREGKLTPRTNRRYEISDGVYLNGAAAGKIMVEDEFKDPGRENLHNVDDIAQTISKDIVKRTKERLEQATDQEVTSFATRQTASADGYGGIGNARYEGTLDSAEQHQQPWLH